MVPGRLYRAGAPDIVASDLRLLVTRLSELGLHLNARKCEVAFLGPSSSPTRSLSTAAIRDILPDISETPLPSLSLLGSPLRDEGIPAALHSSSELVSRLTSRLRTLDSHTALFFLTHHVSAPRLTHLLRSVPAFKEPDGLSAIDEMDDPGSHLLCRQC